MSSQVVSRIQKQAQGKRGGTVPSLFGSCPTGTLVEEYRGNTAASY